MSNLIFRKKNIIKTGVGLCLALFTCVDAKALVTHTLDYTTVAGSSGSLSGSITIDETSVDLLAAFFYFLCLSKPNLFVHEMEILRYG